MPRRIVLEISKRAQSETELDAIAFKKLVASACDAWGMRSREYRLAVEAQRKWRQEHGKD